MRLSELIRNKKVAFTLPPQSDAESVNGNAGGSDNIDGSSHIPAAETAFAADSGSPLSASQPQAELISEDESLNGSSGDTVDGSLYDGLPPAILEAARQLDVKPTGLGLSEAFIKAILDMDEVLEKLLDPSVEKKTLAGKIRKVASDLETFVALEPNVARQVQSIGPADKALSWHSVNTALLAIDIAKLAPRGECSVSDIGIAGLIHDFGLHNARKKINWNPADRKYKEHVKTSVDLAAQMGFPVLIQNLVAQHHERLEGSGFPKGLSGNEIQPGAQIIGLADAVEHLLSGHEGKVLADKTDYVQTALQRYRNMFLPETLKAMVALRGFYPVGSLVELNNRSICLVVRQNEGQPLRPVVQVVMDGAGNHPESAKVVDLRNSPALTILRSVTAG